MSGGFASAFAEGQGLGAKCLAGLGDTSGATLGIVYVSEPAAGSLPGLVRELAKGTGIAEWVGGVGLGICAAGHEVYDRPAASVLTAAVPEESFRVFGSTDDPGRDLPRDHAKWIEAVQPSLALVHADPRCPDLTRAAIDAGTATGAFLVGGLVSHQCDAPLVAGLELGGGGMSGLLLSSAVSVATALTQGCSPVGPVRTIDEAQDNIVIKIDGRPALEVFLEDIGPELAQNLRRLGGTIFVGLPVAGSDTGDYLVRNLMGIDPRQGWIALAAEVAPGDKIMFTRRDPESAKKDLVRMLTQLGGRLSGKPRGGVYVSCIARGMSLFGEPAVETGLIRDTLGDFPLVGFFANGEISRDRLYGYTGVLTLFT
ncbi:MAG TPA: FIST C-terminal domain-containing protein [Stellaceae bacterium]|jgi:small ligand-binding sensory domain FIST|nr:FIST C-terminal domain-containing protein [Stellaceae bacterium]